jgi:pentatricopeptide repeat protein
VQGFTLRKGWFLEDITIGNAVVVMYAKLGLVDSARAVFNWLPNTDVISWNTIISGYAQNGFASEAIEMYNIMEEEGEIAANQGTWVSVLPACSQAGALRQGMKLHGRLLKNGLYLDVFVVTSLADMYGKCGRLEDALSLFYQIPRVNSVPWNTLIACHGFHGHGEKAVMLFKEMLDEGVKPDHITFVTLLSACSHSGLVDEGQWCFEMMQTDYGITPSLKHYGCMVDMYGRAGQLETALKFIKSMSLQPDASIWGALLSACRVHGNVDLGKIASEHLFEVEPEHVGYHVLLSNMYASAGKWEGVDEIRSIAHGKGLRKTPGWSSMEVDNKVEVFYTGNQTHPMYEEMYRELTALQAKLKMIGYVPDHRFVLQDVEDDEKEHILMSHSERLAIAFALIATPVSSFQEWSLLLR